MRDCSGATARSRPVWTEAVPMNALEVAGIARNLALAASSDALASTFLAAAVRAAGLRHACLYGRDAAGDKLLPLLSISPGVGQLPAISMDALDDPLVYSLIGGQPCYIECLSRLVGVGIGFERLAECLGPRNALLVVPQRDSRQQALCVLVLAGEALSLQAWRDEPLWMMLLQIHECLYARLHEQMSATEDARYQRSVRQPQEERRGVRAARLLAAEFIGVSAAAQRIREDMLRFADSTLAVLLTGETGTGKDHAAWLIHQASSRGGKFVPVNCAAIPKDLIEAELFGNVRGAYTGATQARGGLVAEADGGTLFLDEIGDMPFTLQAALLRLLNEKKYRPLGASREQASDFRLICATHQPLPQLIREGRFREDLYFRIRQQTLQLPPLRERTDDIPALAAHVILQHNRERQAHVAGIEPDALAMLESHALPGNVRELRSLLLVAAERTARGASISGQALRQLQTDREGTGDAVVLGHHLHGLLQTDNLPHALDTFERLLIKARLQALDGSRSRTAQSLGIPKRTLARRCQAWNLDQEDTLQ
ncbi:sigma 54-interacting transcriptional regulator [Achromobacter sp. NPDC058515]|uniref:sigma 54-interacting transcriptional regulator n=1 Tax=Achromobacter sp. NPDC058515 TaxID=3346533 RepID=UPI003658D4D8